MTPLLDEAEIAARARRLAGGMLRAGVRAGDVVAALAGNGAAFVAARDAATAVGAWFAPLNARLTPPELADLLARSGAKAIFVDDDHRIESGLPRLTAADDGPAPPRDAAGATILFTSGTTGRPKVCLRPEAAERARIDELTATYAIRAGDVQLIASPLAHSAPGIFLRAGRLAGAATVILPRFDARAMLDTIAAHRVTFAFVVPTQVERLLAARAASDDLSPLRALIVAGAPFAPASKRRVVEWLGPGKLWEFFGSSETGTITVLPPDAQLGKGAGCVGWPPAGVSLELRDGGEIFVRSPANMQGYLGEPPAAPWISVGDVGRLDQDGALVLVDRKHDLVITGGVNVYPAEVERALLEHPRVTGAVVCGVPHGDWGEEVVALVAADAAVAEPELRAFLRDRLAPFKIPKRIRVVPHDELPIGPSGKPLRRAAANAFLR